MALSGGQKSNAADADLRRGETGAAPLRAITAAAGHDVRRGACPSLAAPMMTGDGLLARLRPVTPDLTIPQMRGLALAAQAHGNGILEITARGSLQIRGLKPETVDALAADIAACGIIAQTGIMIEVPPLSGIDPDEIADATIMAAQLRAMIAGLVPMPAVAPKLSIVVDGGGRSHLAAIDADIRVRAVACDGDVLWLISVGGTEVVARHVALVSAKDAGSVVGSLIHLLSRLGPEARGRNIMQGDLEATFPQMRLTIPQPVSNAGRSAGGVCQLSQGSTALRLRLAFGQTKASNLIAFLDCAEKLGVKTLRPAPDRSIFVIGSDAALVSDLQNAAASYGFITRDDEPLNFIAACAGAGACGSGFYETKSAANALAGTGSALLDGSLTVHLSGCAKGCAHPRHAAIVVAGTPTGYGLVVNGSASDAPDAYIGKHDLHSALQGLDLLVRQNKAAGESAQDCLTRLGHDAVTKVARQG